MSKSILLAPALRLAIFALDLLFTSQSMARTSAILNAVISSASIIILFAVLNRHKFSPIIQEADAE